MLNRASPVRTKMTHLCFIGIRRLPTKGGEPVTFCPGAANVCHRGRGKPARKAQTRRRKKPVLMRFLHGRHVFHEKMTFGYRFVHACCINTHIVGNDTRLDAGVSRQKTVAFQCVSRMSSNLQRGLKTALKLSARSQSGCEFATRSQQFTTAL